MFGRIQEHLRGNVVGYLALFVALSGTAYAVGDVNGRNTIGSRQLKPGAVHAADIAKGAVKPKHLGIPLGSDGAVIPDVAVGQGAEPHLLPAVQVNGGHLLITGAIQVTNPKPAGAPPGAAAQVTVRMLLDGSPIGSYQATVPDGQTQTIPVGLERAAASGFQEVDNLKPDIATAGADINVDGGAYGVLVGPGDPQP